MLSVCLRREGADRAPFAWHPILLILSGLLLLPACSDSGPVLPESGQVALEELLTGSLGLDVDPSGRAPLAAQVFFRAHVPVTVSLVVLGEEPWSLPAGEAATDHELHLLGLRPGQANDVEIRLEVPDGPYAVDTFSVSADPLPAFFPEVEIVQANPDAMEPGWTLSNFSVGTGDSFLTYPFIFDTNGQIRWFLDLSEFGGMAYVAEPMDNGNLRLAHGEVILEYDFLGREVARWETPGFLYHHDLIEKPDGNFIVLVSRAGDDVVNDHIIEVDRMSGAIVREWDLRESLDVNRRTFPSSTDQNWVHTNSLWYDVSDDAIVVSGRNQTAVFKLTADNKLVWILGGHEGWGPAGPQGEGPETSDFLLTAVDSQGEPYPEEVQMGHEDAADFSWVWGQHTPVLQPDGRLFVFDNGLQANFVGRAQPDLHSRGVEYEIDEEAGTVRQTWQYGMERGFDYFSPIISNVDHLAQTGNRLVAPGISDGHRAWVTEVTYPEGQVVFEARIDFRNELSSGQVVWGDFDLVYRSRRVVLDP